MAQPEPAAPRCAYRLGWEEETAHRSLRGLGPPRASPLKTKSGGASRDRGLQARTSRRKYRQVYSEMLAENFIRSLLVHVGKINELESDIHLALSREVFKLIWHGR